MASGVNDVFARDTASAVSRLYEALRTEAGLPVN